jgi:hypothetical protein
MFIGLLAMLVCIAGGYLSPDVSAFLYGDGGITAAPLLGMASLTRADYDDILKEFYLPLFEAQFNQQSVLMDKIVMKRDSRHVEGKNAYIALEFESWGGVGSAAEGGTLVTPEAGIYTRTQVPMRFHYAACRLTGPVMEASKSNAGAFAPAWNREITTKINTFHRQVNRMQWNDGSGVLARVDGIGSSPTLGVDAAFGIANDTNGLQFFSKQMNVNFQSAKSGGTDRGDARITAVAPSATAPTITLDADPGVSDNDFIFIEGAAGNEMMGLLGLIDDNNYVTTLQNITTNSGDYQDWVAQVGQGATPGTAEALSYHRINQILRDVNFYGGGDTKFILGDPNVQLTYADMARRERIMVNNVKLDGGWEGLSYNGIPWMADKFAPANRAAFIDPSSLAIYEMSRPAWIDRGEGVLKQVGRTDVWEAQYGWYAEFGVSSRRKNGMLEDILTIS